MATATKKQMQEQEQQGDGLEQSARSSSRQTRHAGQAVQGSLTYQESNGRQRQGAANASAERLARGLGWFSIGLGLAEFLTPRAVAKIAGVEGKHTGLIRLFGLREIASGVAIFAQGRRPAAAVWSRVAGDALDLAALGGALASPTSKKGRTAFAAANVLAVTALDVICARQLSGDGSQAEGGKKVIKSLIINRPPEELYQFWHDFENLPRIMHDLESVTVTGGGRSHWVAKGPAGSRVEWDAEVVEDRPNHLISWRSLEGADVDNSGTVRFKPAPGGRGTIVKVEMEYNPPGGVVGAAFAKLMGEEPGAKALEALRCLKQLVEAGEVIVSDGTFWDNGLLSQRPAQPPSGEELGRSKQARQA
jgi:uncharacterized membrane protein